MSLLVSDTSIVWSIICLAANEFRFLFLLVPPPGSSCSYVKGKLQDIFSLIIYPLAKNCRTQRYINISLVSFITHPSQIFSARLVKLFLVFYFLQLHASDRSTHLFYFVHVYFVTEIESAPNFFLSSSSYLLLRSAALT